MTSTQIETVPSHATYENRHQLYTRVAYELFELGLGDEDKIVEVGAASGEFDYFMRAEQDWRGIYLPIDVSIDGTNLEEWAPLLHSSFFVSIDRLSELRSPFSLMSMLQIRARKGVVVTVPNPDFKEQAPDRRIVTAISTDDFHLHGWEASKDSFFGNTEDSIIAVSRGRGLEGF